MANCNPMEVLFQRRCTNFIYVTPEGLRELMSDISREVLRCQPINLCTFIANYLDALLITRENARVACKLVNRITESSIIVAQLLSRLEITQKVAVKAVQIIQRAFRKHLLKKQPDCPCAAEDNFDPWKVTQKLLRRCNITEMQASEAARIIQRAYRCYRTQLQMLDPCGGVDWRVASRRTLGILGTLDAPAWEREQAATLIKAAYKGYYTRRLLRGMLHREEEKGDVISTHIQVVHIAPEDSETAVVDYDKIMYEVKFRAASVIQRGFRAYLRRKSGEWAKRVSQEYTAYLETKKMAKTNADRDSSTASTN